MLIESISYSHVSGSVVKLDMKPSDAQHFWSEQEQDNWMYDKLRKQLCQTVIFIVRSMNKAKFTGSSIQFRWSVLGQTQSQHLPAGLNYSCCINSLLQDMFKLQPLITRAKNPQQFIAAGFIAFFSDQLLQTSAVQMLGKHMNVF